MKNQLTETSSNKTIKTVEKWDWNFEKPFFRSKQIAKAFTPDVIKPVLQLRLIIMKNYYVNIQNTQERKKINLLTKSTEI